MAHGLVGGWWETMNQLTMAKPVTWGHTCSAYYELSKVLLMLRQDCMASGHILCITKYITGRSDMDGYLLLLLVASKPTNSLDLPYPAQTFTLAFNLHPSSLPPLAGSRFNLWEKSNMDFYSVANRHYSTYERCQTWISILWQVAIDTIAVLYHFWRTAPNIWH